ncbi:TlpA family protein disulfide reductase [Synergistaceae bacterium OttesenSCG-928-I11]|nr:TlpA family protein disulfide reductase [Synergistaceae bacterium OttesenSCG-928-I11]
MRKFAFVITLAVLAIAMAGTAFAADAFPAFKSYNLAGEEVSQEIFAGKKLTMINFWGTYCPPCISEMPDLGELGRSMPEGTQLVGIVIDVGDKETFEKAIEITKTANADFPNILISQEMIPYLETIVAVPTTIFVDAQGNVIGEPIVGSRSGKAYRGEVEKALKLLP